MNNIIFYDNKCKLCNFWIGFIIKRDKSKAFKFSSTNSKYASSLNIKSSYISFVNNDKVYIKSKAIIYILNNLGGLWKLILTFLIIPTFIRDFFYDLIAKNRYKIFGKEDNCIIVNKEYLDRFIN